MAIFGMGSDGGDDQAAAAKRQQELQQKRQQQNALVSRKSQAAYGSLLGRAGNAGYLDYINSFNQRKTSGSTLGSSTNNQNTLG